MTAIKESTAKGGMFNKKTENAIIDISTSGIILYNRYNEEFHFSDTTNYFIVLMNNKYCQDCFRSINEYAREIKKEVKSKFIVVNLSDSTVLSRKRLIVTDRNLMPDFDDFYFQYKNENTKTIFDSLKTNFTPEILIIRKGELTHIPNPAIFEYPSLNINPQIQIQINGILK